MPVKAGHEAQIRVADRTDRPTATGTSLGTGRLSWGVKGVIAGFAVIITR